jgi:hypothetical protein
LNITGDVKADECVVNSHINDHQLRNVEVAKSRYRTLVSVQCRWSQLIGIREDHSIDVVQP